MFGKESLFKPAEIEKGASTTQWLKQYVINLKIRVQFQLVSVFWVAFLMGSHHSDICPKCDQN